MSAENELLTFDGRVAIVTGAGRGIGRDYALLLARRGAAVVVNDLGASVDAIGQSPTPADDVVAEIRAAGGRAVPSYESVATALGAQSIVGIAIEAFGRLDILVNNAGIAVPEPFLQTSPASAQQHLDVHFYGSWHLMQAAWANLRKSDAARVVNTMSISTFGLPGYSAYASAKTAIWGLTRTVAAEWAGDGIAVNAIAPSAGTRMVRAGSMSEEDIQTRARAMPPWRVAPVLAYLCHESCPFTGELVTSAGGRFSRMTIAESSGFFSAELTPEIVASQIDAVMSSPLTSYPTAAARATAIAEEFPPT